MARSMERVVLQAAVVLTIAAVSAVSSAQVPGEVDQRAGRVALTTEVTYQGQLEDGGAPADGEYDLQLTLYDAASGGNQVGSTVVVEDVAVSDGLFTVELDFGDVWDGAALWVEVAVRDGGSSGSFTVLSPLQPLTATPYALHSASTPWAGVTGVPPGLADDEDNDTLGGLSCAGGQVAKWNGSQWVCAPDDVGNYTAGDGLALSGSELRIAALPMGGHVNRVLDTSGATGRNPAIIIGLDGLPLISYYNASTGDLVVYHCDDMLCSSGTRTVLDSGGIVGEYSSITIGGDGFGLISYYDRTNGDLKVADCLNTACTSADLRTVDSSGDVGLWTSITVNDDGYAFISYYDASSGDLKAAGCSTSTCSGYSIWTVDSGGDVGQYSSVVRNGRDYFYISYYDASNGDLKVARCVNMVCSSPMINVVDGTDIAGGEEDNVGQWTSITAAADGNPLISYVKAYQAGASSGSVRVAHCTTSTCSAATVETVISGSAINFMGTSITLGPHGLGLLTLGWDTGTRVYLAQCADAGCTDTIINDGAATTGSPRESSLTIGADGLPVFVYYADSGDELKLVHCSDVTCQPYLRRR